RLVRCAIAGRRLSPDAVALATDDGLIHELMGDDPTGLARALRERRLAKRALDLSATDLPAATPAWPSDDPDLLERVEDRLARDVGLAPGELFLDFPAKPDMLALDLPLVKRDGAVTQLGGADAGAHLCVAPAVAVGSADRHVPLLLAPPLSARHPRQLGIAEHPREPVGGEQEQIARLHRAEVHVGHHVAVRAHAARNHVGVGV